MFPKRKDKFVAWSRAMVEGATVDKPNYSGKSNKGRAQPQRQQRRRRRKRHNAKKD